MVHDLRFEILVIQLYCRFKRKCCEHWSKTLYNRQYLISVQYEIHYVMKAFSFFLFSPQWLLLKPFLPRDTEVSPHYCVILSGHKKQVQKTKWEVRWQAAAYTEVMFSLRVRAACCYSLAVAWKLQPHDKCIQSVKWWFVSRGMTRRESGTPH